MINSAAQIPKNLLKLRHIPNAGSLLALSVLVGFIGGAGAIGFHLSLEILSHYILGDLAGIKLYGSDGSGVIPRWLFFLIPVTGGLLSGFIVYRFAPEAAGHGTDAMIDSFHNGGGRVRKRVPLVKAITSLITISSGGSAGIEGPIAQIGSGMGSILTRFFKMTTRYRRLMLLAGTAAGLGAIFKAPLGGALTSVEILYKEDFESDAIMTSIIASVVAFTTYTAYAGHIPVFGNLPEFEFHNAYELLFYLLLGGLCAPASWFYVKVFYYIHDFFARLKIPNTLKPAIGGLVVGLLFYLRPEIIGGSWEHLVQAMDGTMVAKFGQNTFLVLLLIGFIKILATAFTVGSGGSGGVFGPSLFIGGMLGGAMGYSLNYWFPEIVTQPGAFVLVGMGAFFAGAAKAPIASVVMVCELTGTYSLLPPLMFASVVHIAIAKKWSIYRNQVDNKFSSPAHRAEMNIDILKYVTVGDVLPEVKTAYAVHPNNTLKDLEEVLSSSEDDIFIVTDQGNLVGLLDVQTVRKVIFDPSVASLVIVEDLMRPPRMLLEKMDLHLALQIFIKSQLIQLPVVDDNNKVIAMLRHQDIITAYDNIIRGKTQT
jgi:CIC family chloride channel protein